VRCMKAFFKMRTLVGEGGGGVKSENRGRHSV